MEENNQLITPENGNPGKPEGENGQKMLKRMNESHAPLRDWGFEPIVWKDKMHILDEGCGGGATIADMLHYSDESIVEGIDYMETSVKESEFFNQQYIGTRCKICQGDVANLPYEGETFDLVTAVETIYFWPDIERAFAETYRVMKTGATFAVFCEASDPENHGWSRPADVHFRVYRPEELKTYMENAGMRKVTVRRGPKQYIAVYGVK
ncbi:class I SAM-dependent methyltransferase [Eubacterium oxidoreducens]|uniref:Methyltransferase domain-containing protein n=1 Tax=Eubacterium oxidoreducens TaxID=1732 RepID=A0A1G6A5L7_EUBOX|nr:class I SAM-dependent methyltransferase [Eubacterium oxidoreducens]SDB03734.1 Methyltransferase domain-containing protein [Eubacterium oxidoreducens]